MGIYVKFSPCFTIKCTFVSAILLFFLEQTSQMVILSKISNYLGSGQRSQ